MAIFATAPVLDLDELRADLDENVSQDVHDPYEGHWAVTVHDVAVGDTPMSIHVGRAGGA